MADAAPLGYFEPETIEEACHLLSSHRGQARIIAGGVSLSVLMGQKLMMPKYLVSIKGIKSLNFIGHEPGAGLKIGAATTHADIEKSSLLQEKMPLLSQVAGMVGSAQVRNWGTIGGNLCHADPAADLPPALMALCAQLRLQSSAGARTMPIDKFFLDYFQTAVAEEEILTEINIPQMPPSAGASFIKFTPRSKMDTAVVAVAVYVQIEPAAERIVDVKIALGAVGPTPIRALKAEGALKGQKIDQSTIEQIAELAKEECSPASDVKASAEYRKEMVGVFVKRATKEALERARANRTQAP